MIEEAKWDRPRKMHTFLMFFFIFFFVTAIFRGCYLKHQFNTACQPGQFESFHREDTKEWVVCSDGVGEKAWVVNLQDKL